MRPRSEDCYVVTLTATFVAVLFLPLWLLSAIAPFVRLIPPVGPRGLQSFLFSFSTLATPSSC